MNNDNNVVESSIDVSKLLRLLRNNAGKLTLFTILGLVISLVFAFVLITPKYQGTTDILVNQKISNNQVQLQAQQADLQAINTYKDVLKKEVILAPVLKEIKKQDNYQGKIETLSKSISVSNQTNSQVISISATDTNAYTAADIANTTAEVFTKRIKKMMKVDNVSIVSRANVDLKPVSPNKKLFALAGMVVGFMFGIVLIVARELFDRTVKDTNYLSDLGLTNLGVVYHLDFDDEDYNVVRAVDVHGNNNNNTRV